MSLTQEKKRMIRELKNQGKTHREVAKELPIENQEQIRIQEINFWNEWLVLILFLLLLAFEWIIRRRKGML